MPCIVVLGTGTEVGKTHATVALVTEIASRGIAVCGLKPIESGVDGQMLTDGARLARASSVPVEPAPYCFPEPVSPHLAARRANVTISADGVTAWIRSHRAQILVVETAGAVLSPLGPAMTNLDLTRALAPTAIVLVGLDRLGILHDIRACRTVLQTLAPELPPPVVILNAPPAPDASTGTNPDELTRLGIAANVIALPRAEPTSQASIAAARRVLRLLGF